MTFRAEWTDEQGGGYVVVDQHGGQYTTPRSSRESVEDLADAMSIAGRHEPIGRAAVQEPAGLRAWRL